MYKKNNCEQKFSKNCPITKYNRGDILRILKWSLRNKNLRREFMKLDFNEPISGYEFLALLISIIALLVPLFVYLWRKFVQKAKLNYYPNGSIELFFNLSGSYVRFFGTLQAENKPVVVQKISLKIIRLKDNSERNLLWSSFISPYTQSLGNNFVLTSESIHAYFVDTKNVACAFLEFADPSQSVYKEYNNTLQEYGSEINELVLNNDYKTAIELYEKTQCYKELGKILDKDFFWEIGKYSLEITFEYEKTSKKCFYNFSIGELENRLMKNNMNETLHSPIKDYYKVMGSYNNCRIEVNLDKEL